MDLTGSLVGDPPFSVRRRLKVNGERRLRYWLNKRYESEEAKRFVGKVRNGFDHWFTFVVVPGLEPTNNRAERRLRSRLFSVRSLGRLGMRRVFESTRL